MHTLNDSDPGHRLALFQRHQRQVEDNDHSFFNVKHNTKHRHPSAQFVSDSMDGRDKEQSLYQLVR